MDITLHPSTGMLEIRLNGRFDAAWADYVSETLEDAVRAGSHQITLDFAQVSYISSLGIGVLLKHYNRLKAVQGTLVVVRPSASTLAVIKASGLTEYLLARDAATPAAPPAPAKVPVRTAEHGGASFEIYTQMAGATFACDFIGDPGAFARGYSEGDCRSIDLPDGSVALGLGAFGEGFADCRPRFGEFAAAGGCAVTLPTSEQGVPDYVVTQGTLVPQVKALYAISARGHFASMLRFDEKTDESGLVRLSQLVDSALELTTAEAGCFAIVAEAAGVIGASLRRSPAAGPAAGSPLDFPGVRDWLSFTTERSGERQIVFIVGVAARRPSAQAAAFLRPLAPGSLLHGHFHAVVFPYRPVQRGELKLSKTVTDLLAASAPQTVRHLMADSRPIEGVGETELVRGACWTGPIAGWGAA